MPLCVSAIDPRWSIKFLFQISGRRCLLHMHLSQSQLIYCHTHTAHTPCMQTTATSSLLVFCTCLHPVAQTRATRTSSWTIQHHAVWWRGWCVLWKSSRNELLGPTPDPLGVVLSSQTRCFTTVEGNKVVLILQTHLFQTSPRFKSEDPPSHREWSMLKMGKWHLLCWLACWRRFPECEKALRLRLLAGLVALGRKKKLHSSWWEKNQLLFYSQYCVEAGGASAGLKSDVQAG